MTRAGSVLKVEILNARDATNAILKFTREKRITQIFVGHSKQARAWKQFLSGNLIENLIRSAEGMDVIVYPN